MGKRWQIYWFFFQLVTPDTEVGTEGCETQGRILQCKELFISTRLTQRNFSGKSRPVAVGTFHTVESGTVFFKELATDVDEDELRRYEVTKEYLLVFNERSNKGIISNEFSNKFLDK